MDKDGRNLEQLVCFIERLHLPPGLSAKTNKKVFDEDGGQIAEFDVEIRGKVGTTDFAWLIECRDRPSNGPAPGSWIEQLVGRRARFGFNKVTAVSTTGFAPGAEDFARTFGIELRCVKELEPKEFSDWLMVRTMPRTQRGAELITATFAIPDTETIERRDAFLQFIRSKSLRDPMLRCGSTDQVVSTLQAFTSATNENPQWFDTLLPNGPAVSRNIKVFYRDPVQLSVDTHLGTVCVQAILFQCNLFLKVEDVPLSFAAEYSNASGGKMISQSAGFVIDAFDSKLSVEFHKLGETGELAFVIRNVGPSETQ